MNARLQIALAFFQAAASTNSTKYADASLEAAVKELHGAAKILKTDHDVSLELDEILKGDVDG